MCMKILIAKYSQTADDGRLLLTINLKIFYNSFNFNNLCG